MIKLEVRPYERCSKAPTELITGAFRCPCPGVATLAWHNDYSRWHAKHVAFKATVVPPGFVEDAQARLEGARSGCYSGGDWVDRGGSERGGGGGGSIVQDSSGVTLRRFEPSAASAAASAAASVAASITARDHDGAPSSSSGGGSGSSSIDQLDRGDEDAGLDGDTEGGKVEYDGGDDDDDDDGGGDGDEDDEEEPVMCCPAGHELAAFATPTTRFTCSGCSGAVPKHSTLHGCRPCDFDLCPGCAATALDVASRRTAALAQTAAAEDIGRAAAAAAAAAEALEARAKARAVHRRGQDGGDLLEGGEGTCGHCVDGAGGGASPGPARRSRRSAAYGAGGAALFVVASPFVGVGVAAVAVGGGAYAAWRQHRSKDRSSPSGGSVEGSACGAGVLGRATPSPPLTPAGGGGAKAGGAEALATMSPFLPPEGGVPGETVLTVPVPAKVPADAPPAAPPPPPWKTVKI